MLGTDGHVAEVQEALQQQEEVSAHGDHDHAAVPCREMNLNTPLPASSPMTRQRVSSGIAPSAPEVSGSPAAAARAMNHREERISREEETGDVRGAVGFLYEEEVRPV
jgi:hypothetical protein